MEVEKGTTEDKIVEATLKLLFEEGLNNITTRKIADKASVSEVTIFRKFKTKKELLRIAKKHCLQHFINEISNILEFDEKTELKEYLIDIWKKCVILSDEHLNIIKIALEEIREVPDEEKVLPKYSREIINKLSEFFQLQIDKKVIREINTHVAALTIFSTILEALILWKVYGENPEGDIDSYLNDFLDIFLKGIAI